jgi:hypothetical protein
VCGCVRAQGAAAFWMAVHVTYSSPSFPLVCRCRRRWQRRCWWRWWGLH